MNKPVKTKLCWNCEGSVSRTAENCPYCGVYLSPDPSEAKEEAAPAPIKAPYVPEQASKVRDIPKAPYQPKQAAEQAQETPAQQTKDNLNGVFLPVFLLSAGAITLFFALILLLFSTKGKLLLEWDADNWYYYALIALPLLFLGWKKLEK